MAVKASRQSLILCMLRTAKNHLCLIFFIMSMLSSSSSSAEQPLSPDAVCAVECMASAIRANVSTVLIGQIRADGAYRDMEPALPKDRQFPMVLTVLDLERVFVQQTLKSPAALPPVIYLQAKAGAADPTGRKWTGDLFADDGIRIMFLRAGEKLNAPRLLRGSANKVDQTIAQFHAGIPAANLFQKLAVDQYLNADTWLQLYDNRAAIRLDRPKPKLPAIHVEDPQSRAILAENQQRANDNYFEKHLKLFVLEKEFPADLRLILAAYGSGNGPPAPGSGGSSATGSESVLERLRALRPKLITQTGRALCTRLIELIEKGK